MDAIHRAHCSLPTAYRPLPTGVGRGRPWEYLDLEHMFYFA
jgi:hypothetical protein